MPLRELTIFGVMVLLVRIGLLMYLSGLARSKNAANTALRSVIDLCLVALAFWAVGAAIAFQDHNPVFGFKLKYLLGWDANAPLMFVGLPLLATGVISGASGERSKFRPICFVSMVLGGLLLPILIHWTNSGWLARLHFIDETRVSLLLLSAGLCAAVGAHYVAARTGKYHHDGSASMIPGHNLPQAVTGVLLMLAGWMGIAGVTALPSTATNVFFAACAGGIASLLYSNWRYSKPDMLLCCSGLLTAGVAVLASGPALGTPGAVLTGAIVGALAAWATVYLDLNLHIDDPSGLVVVNVVGSLAGLLVAGFVHATGFGDALKQLSVQLLGIAACGVLTLAVSIGLFTFLRRSAGLRSRDADEYDGLDLAEHEINAYPDFQQTMIKSYHMREA